MVKVYTYTATKASRLGMCGIYNKALKLVQQGRKRQSLGTSWSIKQKGCHTICNQIGRQTGPSIQVGGRYVARDIGLNKQPYIHVPIRCAVITSTSPDSAGVVCALLLRSRMRSTKSTATGTTMAMGTSHTLQAGTQKLLPHHLMNLRCVRELHLRARASAAQRGTAASETVAKGVSHSRDQDWKLPLVWISDTTLEERKQ